MGKDRIAMLRCESCGSVVTAFDSRCPQCGAAIGAIDLLQQGTMALTKSDNHLPAPWKPVRPRLWQGLAALAVGTALELLRREVVRRLTAPSAPPKTRSIVSRGPLRPDPLRLDKEDDRSEGEYELHEFFYFRRVVRRSDRKEDKHI